jgi:hypothetical protein
MVNAGGILLIAHNNHSKKLIFESHKSEDNLRRSLQTLAITDPLTGIPNRRSFFEQAQQEFSRFERIKKTFCLVMIDLDLFKHVNDRFGHLAGDEALKEFTTCVLSAKRFLRQPCLHLITHRSPREEVRSGKYQKYVNVCQRPLTFHQKECMIILALAIREC